MGIDAQGIYASWCMNWVALHIADCWSTGRGWTTLAISHECWSNLRTLKAWGPFYYIEAFCLSILMWLSIRLVFCTAVLPMAARNIDGRSVGTHHYHRESLQVLQSYMTVSKTWDNSGDYIIYLTLSLLFLDLRWACCADEILSWTHNETERSASWVLKRIRQTREWASYKRPKRNVRPVT
jgi:hypothetical protein